MEGWAEASSAAAGNGSQEKALWGAEERQEPSLLIHLPSSVPKQHLAWFAGNDRVIMNPKVSLN